MIEAWQRALKAFLGPCAVLVGIGNRLRGDDAFGPILVDLLQGKVHWPVLDVGETPENYIGSILSLEPKQVLLLDAAKWGAPPGKIGFFPSGEILWGSISTHAASLRLFAEVLGDRGGCVAALLAAQPGSTEMGAPLSTEVKQSVNAIAACVESFAGACRETVP